MTEPTQAPPYRPVLMFVNVELTLRCNLRCLHCGSSAGSARANELDLAAWLDAMDQLAAAGCREVCVLGGEPLLVKGWWDIGERIGDLGMDLVYITNGWCITPTIVDKLRDLSALDRIGVSLDGATAKTHDHIRGRKGSFDRAKNAIWMLRDAGFEVGAITAVSRLNLQDLIPLSELLLNQDITWQLQTVAGHGDRWSEEWNLSPQQHYQVAEFIARSRTKYGVDRLPVAGSHCIGYHSTRLTGYAELPEWPGCMGGLATLGICSNGDIKPCLSQPDEYIVGNLRKEPLAVIWSDDDRFKRNRQFSREMLTGFCKKCPYAETCRAGCPNLPLADTGQHTENRFCLYRLEQQGAIPPNPLKEGWL
jgi:radical SAM protein with 4Fe4S-binding SPASM domain